MWNGGFPSCLEALVLFARSSFFPGKNDPVTELEPRVLSWVEQETLPATGDMLG